jgi:hypothetical protein
MMLLLLASIEPEMSAKKVYVSPTRSIGASVGLMEPSSVITIRACAKAFFMQRGEIDKRKTRVKNRSLGSSLFIWTLVKLSPPGSYLLCSAQVSAQSHFYDQ